MKRKTMSNIILVGFITMIILFAITAYRSASVSKEVTESVEFKMQNFWITTPSVVLIFSLLVAMITMESDEDK